MAASANPSGKQNQEQSAFNGGASTSNGNSGPRQDNSGSGSGMKHNPGIDTDWTSDEQATLDDGLTKYSSDCSVVRYAKIAKLLPNKTVRDVALRIRWMNKKEINKRRKDDHSRKSKDKKEKVNDLSSKSSQLASRPGAPPYSMPPISVDNDDGVSYKSIGGPTGELLEQNARFFEQITSNFSSFQIQENISLFCQARDNITKILNSMNDTPEMMKQMPPLPVKLNEDIANTILPRMPHHHQMQ